MFSVSSQSSYVLPDTTPGTDASNPYDEELEAELQEFSDDEKVPGGHTALCAAVRPAEWPC